MSVGPEQSRAGLTIEARNISVRRSGVEILKGVAELDIGPGLTVLMGPSGSGKSTLANVLYGLIQPSTGRVRHRNSQTGEVMYTNKPFERPRGMKRLLGMLSIESEHESGAAAHRRKLGYIPQEPFIPAGMQASRYVDVVRSALGSDFEPGWADRLFGALGVGDDTNKTTRELSGGELQRFIIAFALAHKPPYVVADEPTSALDRASGIRAMELFRDITRPEQENPYGLPTSMLVVSHDETSVSYADRLIRISDGQIVSDELL